MCYKNQVFYPISRERVLTYGFKAVEFLKGFKKQLLKKGFAPNLRNRLERHSVRNIAKQSIRNTLKNT